MLSKIFCIEIIKIGGEEIILEDRRNRWKI